MGIDDDFSVVLFISELPFGSPDGEEASDVDGLSFISVGGSPRLPAFNFIKKIWI
jgi:hypothetical protein